MLFSAESAVTVFFTRSVLVELCNMRHAEGWMGMCILCLNQHRGMVGVLDVLCLPFSFMRPPAV
uniref:Uncharacterized protein n=1 Tax=Populus trichocarpa TaxID=3694 RepID=A9PDM3_POPTR|nr:unknown [Populus trichocarpa]